ncbi:MAG: DUF4326 domain-containing protein [Crocosphaera sp.]
MLTLQVINGKKTGFIGNNKIYVGRRNRTYNLQGSLLQNKFGIGRDGNREEVVEKYRQWLWSEVKKKGEVFNELIRIGKKVKAGEKVELVCWCKPYSCHGDIIKRCINWMIKENIV